MDLVTIWVRSSYLYIRAIKQPLHYGFPANATIEIVEQKLEGETFFYNEQIMRRKTCYFQKSAIIF